LNESETVDDARRGISGYSIAATTGPTRGSTTRRPTEVKQTWEDLQHIAAWPVNSRGARHIPQHPNLDAGPLRLPKVLFVDHIARLSGGEIALVRLISALHGSVDAHVILGEEGPLIDRLEAEGARVEVLPLNLRVRDLRRGSVTPLGLGAAALIDGTRYAIRLSRRIRELKPDIVHTNSLKGALYGGLAGRLARVPVVWHVRDRIAPDYLPRSAVRLVRALALILPTAIIANSQTTLSTLPARHRRHVVYGIVNDPFESPVRRSRQTKMTTVGMVGRLAPWKGQHIFLEAFALSFLEDKVRARVIGSAMFGEDAYERELRGQAKKLGIESQVEFRGFREDIWAELGDLDVLVHCSVAPEPFGQVVVEGMAAGLAVVAAAAGGPAEVITDGVDGFLTRPGDARELAAALRVLVDDPELRLRIGHRARASSERFQPAAIAALMLKVYLEVKKGSGGRR
jgi:glycosyltransferase involved in cell wall biosynthesis